VNTDSLFYEVSKYNYMYVIIAMFLENDEARLIALEGYKYKMI